MQVLLVILSAVIGYLFGTIPVGACIARLYGNLDIRKHGSGNTGTTNVLRTLGWVPSLLTLLGDCLKGVFGALIGRWLGGEAGMLAGGFFAVLGHDFPVFTGFRGGKGVATLVGAVTGIYPPVALLCFGVWFVMLMISHYVSLSSMVAGCCFPAFTLISPKVNGSVAFVVFSFVIAILLIYTHRKNIERLKAGTESKIYIWKPRRTMSGEKPEEENKEPDQK